MHQSDAQSWWADVQHVRESIERRRAVGDPDSGDRPRSTRFVRAADASPSASFEDLDVDTLATRVPSRRFERPGHTHPGGHDGDGGRVRDHRTDGERRDPSRSDRRSAARSTHRSSDRFDRRDPSGADRRAGADTDRRASSGAVPGPARSASVTPLVVPTRRRTVQITGRPMNGPRLVEVERRRPVRRPVERIGGRPDRIALWAVLLGFFLILVAASSGGGF